MISNAKPSDQAAILAVLNPVSQAAGTVLTGWVSMADVEALMAVLQTGVLGTGATVDAKLRQATSAAGANAKDITGKAIAQLTKAANDNDQVVINCRADELDVEGGFTHVALSITVANAASLISAILLGFNGRYQPVAHLDSVIEVVN